MRFEPDTERASQQTTIASDGRPSLKAFTTYRLSGAHGERQANTPARPTLISPSVVNMPVEGFNISNFTLKIDPMSVMVFVFDFHV